jgi:hypothetical protein
MACARRHPDQVTVDLALFLSNAQSCPQTASCDTAIIVSTASEWRLCASHSRKEELRCLATPLPELICDPLCFWCASLAYKHVLSGLVSLCVTICTRNRPSNHFYLSYYNNIEISRLMGLLLSNRNNFWVEVEVTLRLTVRQYVFVSSTLVGLATRYYFLSEGCCLKFVVFFLWGALSDERTGLQFAV